MFPDTGNSPYVGARLVAEGVGLPAVWRMAGADLAPFCWAVIEEQARARGRDPLSADMDLSDPQTAFGVALRLDEWERARDPDADDTWREWVASWVSLPRYPELMQRMAARLTHIGRDHAIRRALGWEVAAGSLAKLEQVASGNDDAWWAMTQPGGRLHHFTTDEGASDLLTVTHVPALAGITDPAEALRTIYKEVCND